MSTVSATVGPYRTSSRPDSRLRVSVLRVSQLAATAAKSGTVSVRLYCSSSCSTVWKSRYSAITRPLPVLPAREAAHRAQEVDLPEGRPVRLAEVQLGVRALPQQEVREALLAAGADDQLGVRLAGGVEMPGDVLLGERAGELGQRGTRRGRLVQQLAQRLGDLLAAAVAD